MSRKQTTPEEWRAAIREAVAEPDPGECNRKITAVHYALGQALIPVFGGPKAGANFHTWAVWGSRKAGVTIRQEDLESAVRDAAVVSGAVGVAVGGGVARLALKRHVRRFPGDVPAAVLLGTAIGAAAGRAIAIWSRREAARLILKGNRTVLEDIGGQTVRFIEAFANETEPDPARFAEFAAGFRPGPVESGGQDRLLQAYRQFYRAKYAETLRERRQAMFFANCLVILYEHLRLEPMIRGSMPFIIRKCVTKRMISFEVGDHLLEVSTDVTPDGDNAFPKDLQAPQDPDLQAFLAKWTPRNDAKHGASDWTRLPERMDYIVRLFRAYHMDPAVLSAPKEIAEPSNSTAAARV